MTFSSPADTDRVNAENQARTAPKWASEIRRRAASAHQALLAASHSAHLHDLAAYARAVQGDFDRR